MISNTHNSVFLKEVTDNLITDKEGIYIDATFGLGGHSRSLLTKLSKNAKLFCVDWDYSTKEYYEELNDERSKFIILNFADITKFLWKHEYIEKVNGIIYDLGYSTPQLTNNNLSYEMDGELNMNLNSSGQKNAHLILNKYSKTQLTVMFKKYGELKDPSKLVNAITFYRKNKYIKTIKELNSIIEKIFLLDKFLYKKKPHKLIYQAIRMEVNDEIKNLEKSLFNLNDILIKKGRALYITFNSLEERVIKNWIKNNCYPIHIDDYAESVKNKFVWVNNKVIYPSDYDINMNWKSRSAKLWIIEKVL